MRAETIGALSVQDVMGNEAHEAIKLESRALADRFRFPASLIQQAASCGNLGTGIGFLRRQIDNRIRHKADAKL